MEFDPTPYRRETPAVMAGRIHLNNAGASLMPRPVVEAIVDHVNQESAMGGYEAAEAEAASIEQVYEDVAALVGAHARNIAAVENATVAFALALSAFDFETGDVILTTRNDYISNQLMYLSLAARRGVRVVRAADAPEGGVDPDSMRALIARERPRLVALTWVPTNSGLVQPAAEIGALCADAGVPYLLDACQAVGQIPIDTGALHCDYLAATARKFLRGPRGVGFLYVSDDALGRGDHPLFIDMRGAAWLDDDEYRLVADARRFENWEFAYALVLGMGRAARYAREVGVERAGAYAAGLAQSLRDRLAGFDGVRVLDRGAARCAIVTVEFRDYPARDIVERLREEAINTSATVREWAVIDMKEKQAATAVRISPHYFNTERDLRILVSALEEFVG
ncbi:MAG: aminotransferase class V-fold PLP-dependent enzyme [Gemmatimonadota bacterium]|jgi:selenocysteine lyase/cysteine desulfurase